MNETWNDKKTIIIKMVCNFGSGLYEIEKCQVSYLFYLDTKEFNIKKWYVPLWKRKKITLQYCQLPFLPFHTHTQTKQNFSSYSSHYIFSFLLISFSFSWNVHWVLSLSPVQCMYFIVWRWRVDSGKKSEKILP